MATYSSHGTLVAATATRVTFTENFRQIEIINRGSTDIFFTTDGTTDAVSAAADTYVCPANTAVIAANDQPPNEPAAHAIAHTSVSLISSGTPTYSVSGRPFQRSY